MLFLRGEFCINFTKHRRSQMFFKIDVLKNFEIFTEKHLCWGLFLIKLQVATQVFSCEYWEVFKNRVSYYIEHLWLLILKLQNKAVTQRCSVKKVFLEISQNSKENTCARDSFLINLQAKKESLAQVFPVNFAKFLRTHFLTEHLWWLLLILLRVLWKFSRSPN